MPEFRKVSKGLWASEDFQSLSPLPPSGQSLWLFLLTNPFPEFIPGIINAGPAACAEKLGWDADAIALAIGEAKALGMIEVDPKGRMIWLPAAIKYNPPTSVNQVKAWGKQLETVPKCDLLYRALDVIRESISLMDKAFIQAFDALPKPMATPLPKPMAKDMAKPLPKAHPKATLIDVDIRRREEEEREEKNSGAPKKAAPVARDPLRDALAESFKAKVPAYVNPAKENSSLLKLALAIRRKAEAVGVEPEVAARGTIEVFWRLHGTGKPFYADFTPSKMLAILEGLWGEWAKAREAADTSWIEEALAKRGQPAEIAAGTDDDGF